MRKSGFVLISFLAFAMSAPSFAWQSSEPTVNFAVDCMIHDAHGALLKDLGTLGLLMDGTYVSFARFPYNSMQVEVGIQGPTTAAPEVDAPVQIVMRFVKSGAGNQITAGVIADLTADRNVALFEPTLNVYLHCDKMKM